MSIVKEKAAVGCSAKMALVSGSHLNRNRATACEMKNGVTAGETALRRGGAAGQLARLITLRSQVRILLAQFIEFEFWNLMSNSTEITFVRGPMDGMRYWDDREFANGHRFVHHQKHSDAVYLFLKSSNQFRFHHFETIKQKKAKK